MILKRQTREKEADRIHNGKVAFSAHFKDVPSAFQDAYKAYIKQDLVEDFSYLEDDVEFAREHSLENAIAEFADCVE